MAVIREKRQFKIGTIGVARASEGGRIVGDAIARSANTLGEMFYRDAAQAAEKAGLEAGASAEREKVITMNPETGEPEAYAAPTGMGSIATDAYQRVIMRRFQQSIQEEIQNKGKELAVRYENSPNSVALYETAMSDYLASMTNVAQDEFKGFITDVGTSYLNSTKTNLGIAQIRRERVAAKKAQAAAVDEGLGNIEMMIAQVGPSALQGPTTVNGVISSVSAAANDGGEAGLFGPAEIRSYGRAGQLAVAQGLVRYAASQTDDPDDLRLLQHAIGTQNPNAVPAQFPEVADALRGFGSDFSGLDKLEKFSDGLLSDAVQYSEVIQRQEAEAQAAENAQVVFNMQNNLAGRTVAEKGFAVNRGPLAVARRAEDEWNRLTQNAGVELANGRKGVSDQLLEERNAVLGAQASGLYAKALSGLGTEDTDALENAIVNRNPMLAPESARLELNALFRMERATGQPVLNNFMSEISAYRSSAGKNVDSIKQAAAAQEALGINLSSVLFADNPDEAVQSVVSQVRGIKNLPESEAEAMISSAYLNAGTNALNTFFANANLNEDQLREARSVFEGGAVQEGVLSEAQVGQVNRARAYAQEAGKLSQLRTTFNSQVGTAQDRIKARDEATKLSSQMTSIQIGQASPTQKGNREVFEQMVSDKHANGQDISRLWGSPESTTSPAAVSILNEVTQKGILPESLHNTFTSLAEGEFRVGDPNAVLSHYVNVRDYQFEGQRINNPAINSLSEDQRAMLDYLADVVDVEGNISADRMAAVYNQMSEFNQDKAKRERVEALLEVPLDDFVLTLDGIEEAPYSSVNAMKSATLSLISLGASRREIKKRLENQMERTYPDGQGYVVNPNGGDRTRFPLSSASYGREDLFKNHVSNVVSEATNLQSFSLGGERIRVQGGPRGSGLVRPEDSIYLVPLDASDNGEVRYLVKRSRNLEEGGDEVITGTFAEGETMYQAPIIISNRDPAFVESVRQATLREDSDRLEKAREKKAEESNPMFGLGGINMKRFFD